MTFYLKSVIITFMLNGCKLLYIKEKEEKGNKEFTLDNFPTITTIGEAINFVILLNPANQIAWHSTQEVEIFKRTAVDLIFDPQKLLLDPSSHPLFSNLQDKSKEFLLKVFEYSLPEYRKSFLKYQWWIWWTHRISDHKLPDIIKDIIKYNEKYDWVEEEYGRDAKSIRLVASDIGRRRSQIIWRIKQWMVYR